MKTFVIKPLVWERKSSLDDGEWQEAEMLYDFAAPGRYPKIEVYRVPLFRTNGGKWNVGHTGQYRDTEEEAKSEVQAMHEKALGRFLQVSQENVEGS